MYKKDLALNNLQWLICLKAQPNQKIFPNTLSGRSDFRVIDNLAIVIHAFS